MTTVADKLAKKSAKKPSSKQVRLKLVYIDFWSAVKLSFLLAIAVAIITIVAAFLIYTVVERTGVLDSINGLYQAVAGEGDDLTALFGLNRVMGFALVAAVLNLIVVTALGALSAALYNLSVKITGGVLVGFTNN